MLLAQFSGMGFPAEHQTLSPCTALVFPGQGCQRVGMGRDFHESFETARRVYEEASDATRLDLARLCFEDEDLLGLTEYAQPAILATEIAMARVVTEELGLVASFYGGHSLGEYTALVAAGALGLGEAASLVRERGRLMQNAVPVGTGAMVAVIAPSLDAERVAASVVDLDVVLANDNSADQVVLSGLARDMEAACDGVRAALGDEKVRFIRLDVSAPFHSRLMAPAEHAFEPVLATAASGFDAAAAASVTSNVSGELHGGGAEEIARRLLEQFTATVRWRANMCVLSQLCASIVEIGPGRPLGRFFRSVGTKASSITSLKTARRLVGSV